MIRTFFLLITLLIPLTATSQKFMIDGKDTVPFHLTPVVHTDTEYYGSSFVYPGDTTYTSPCATFEKLNRNIVNVTDGSCMRQGLWIITDSSGNYWKGNYKDNHDIGVWRKFDKANKLIEESESVWVIDDVYLVKKVDYVDGKPIVIVNRPVFKFLMQNIILISTIILISFFIRVFVNSRIYNSENGTNFSPFEGILQKGFGHSLLSMYTLWFFNYKPENRKLVIVSNTLSIISVGGFIGLIITFALLGELH